MAKQKSYYYNIETDLKEHPNNWCWVIFGGRNTGKTYSSLCHCIDTGEKFVYLKRTADDVKLITSGNSLSKKMVASVDLSPFKSINRDRHINIRAFQVQNGLGAFFYCNDDNEPHGNPVGYILALSVAGKFKGMDFSNCDSLIFDEFCPKMWDRTMRAEGEAVLDLYKTIGRDREHRGKAPLKLICLANSDNVASALTNTLEITDTVAEMSLHREAEKELTNRGIYIHRIIDNEEFMKKEGESYIYRAMKDTAWGRMSLDNDFGFNDFSQIGKGTMKHYVCIAKYTYKHDTVYIYHHKEKDLYIVTRSKSTNTQVQEYNLDTESGQKHFWNTCGFTLLLAHEVDRVCFESYTMYDMIVRYKNYFKI